MPKTRSSAWAMARSEAKVKLDLNNPVFQDNLLTLQKPERHVALDTLHKIRQLTWNQLYRDPGLRWEKIIPIIWRMARLEHFLKDQARVGLGAR